MSMTNGGPPAQGAADQAPPSLNVLAQYVKDLSFENPNAPRSLTQQPQQQPPKINIQINVNAKPLADNDYEVELKIEGTRVSVRDFGRGMPARLRQGFDLNGSHVGVGLSGMRERVTDLGGSLDIESNSHGTAIIVALPLAAVQPSGESPASQGNLGKSAAPEGSHPNFEEVFEASLRGSGFKRGKVGVEIA